MILIMIPTITTNYILNKIKKMKAKAIFDCFTKLQIFLLKMSFILLVNLSSQYFRL